MPDARLVGTAADGADPEQEALLADSVGLALLVVLETLTPAERLAFVLHDMFAVPFDEIGADRRPLDRRRARCWPAAPGAGCSGATVAPDPDWPAARGRRRVPRRRRDGDFDALVALLDPDVVLRADAGRGAECLRARRGGGRRPGAHVLPGSATAFEPVLVNGVAGLVARQDGRPSSCSPTPWSAAGSSRSTCSPTRSAWPVSSTNRA